MEYFRQHQKRIANAQRIVILGGGAVGVRACPSSMYNSDSAQLTSIPEMATDIKEYYPTKDVTLVHSRDKLMTRFHSKLHDIVVARFKELGIEFVVGDRAIVPAEGFPVEEGEFDVVLQSGKKIATDFAVRNFRASSEL